MHYTLRQIIDSLPKKKNGRSAFFVRHFFRPLSFPLTYVFINANWSANAVSVLSLFIVLLGGIFLSINNFWLMFAGIMLIYFWMLLDCVDGNIARCTKYKTFMGDFYDAVAGYASFAFSIIGVGMAAYHTSYLFPESFHPYFILIGCTAAMLNLYTRLIHQKYLNCYFVAKNILGMNDEITLKDTENKRSFAYIREFIDKNIGMGGIFMPWLLIALFTKTFEIMLFFYALYYLASFAAILFLYLRKAAVFEDEAQKMLKEKGITL